MDANSVYEDLPECGERRCTVTRTEDLRAMRFVYQHGDNHEAVLLVDRISCALDPAAEVRRRLKEFAERCHRYDDGEPLDPPQPSL